MGDEKSDFSVLFQEIERHNILTFQNGLEVSSLHLDDRPLMAN